MVHANQEQFFSRKKNVFVETFRSIQFLINIQKMFLFCNQIVMLWSILVKREVNFVVLESSSID